MERQSRAESADGARKINVSSHESNKFEVTSVRKILSNRRSRIAFNEDTEPGRINTMYDSFLSPLPRVNRNANARGNNVSQSENDDGGGSNRHSDGLQGTNRTDRVQHSRVSDTQSIRLSLGFDDTRRTGEHQSRVAAEARPDVSRSRGPITWLHDDGIDDQTLPGITFAPRSETTQGIVKDSGIQRKPIISARADGTVHPPLPLAAASRPRHGPITWLHDDGLDAATSLDGVTTYDRVRPADTTSWYMGVSDAQTRPPAPPITWLSDLDTDVKGRTVNKKSSFTDTSRKSENVSPILWAPTVPSDHWKPPKLTKPSTQHSVHKALQDSTSKPAASDVTSPTDSAAGPSRRRSSTTSHTNLVVSPPSSSEPSGRKVNRVNEDNNSTARLSPAGLRDSLPETSRDTLPGLIRLTTSSDRLIDADADADISLKRDKSDMEKTDKKRVRLGLVDDTGVSASPSVELLYTRATPTSAAAAADDDEHEVQQEQNAEEVTDRNEDAAFQAMALRRRTKPTVVQVSRMLRRRGATGSDDITAAVTVMNRRHKWLKKHRKQYDIPVFTHTLFTIEGTYGSSVGSLFNFAKWIFCLNIALFSVWLVFIVMPQAVSFDYSTLNNTFYLSDLINAHGPVEQMWWFYGNVASDIGDYRQWFLFIVCIYVTFFASAFFIIRGISRTLQKTGGSHLTTASYPFSSLVLLAWDYSISNREAASAQATGIAISFRDMQADIEVNARVTELRRLKKSIIYLPRAIAWSIAVLLMAGGCSCIFYIGSIDIAKKLHEAGYAVEDDNFFITLTPAVSVVVIDLVLSTAIYKLPRLENYIKPKMEFYVTVIRVFGIKSATVIVTLLGLRARMHAKLVIGCAGTIIGQEMHRSLIVKTISLVADPVLYLAVWLVSRLKRKKQFFMVPVIHNIIQTQALVWIGMLGYPLTPLYGMVYITVAIYMYHWMLRVLSRPMERRWIESNRGIFFLAILGAMLLAVIGVIIGISVLEDQYFFSIFVPANPNDTKTDIEEIKENLKMMKNSSGILYCGPIDPYYMLNPMRGLSAEFHPDSHVFAKFLRIISSNTCILTLVFILASFLYILSERITWEIERREVYMAEVELERLEARYAKSGGRTRR